MPERPATRHAAFAFVVLLALAATAHAHVVYGTSTLRQLVSESDLVVRARIVDPRDELVLSDPPLRETLVVAEVLERFKGPNEEGPLRFVQHGHGVPTYEKGEEVALFLQRIGRNRELGGSPLAEHVQWVSVQEAGAKFSLGDGSRAAFVSALRSYAGWQQLPGAEKPAALRRITVELLASPDPRVASSAVRDIVAAPDLPIVTREDVPNLETVLASDATAIGVRVALLTELERRALLDAPPQWARLLRETRGRDRFTVIRAASQHPSPAVTNELVKLLASDDPLLASSAAVSLGTPGNEAAVAPLAKLLDSDEPRVRMAAIRGLGTIRTPGASEALAHAATSNPDPATRRRASAALARDTRPTP